MKLIDADALRERLDVHVPSGPSMYHGLVLALTIIDAAPSINCAADNPHGLVPSKCPTCGGELVPYPCMDLEQDAFRDGILYGRQLDEIDAEDLACKFHDVYEGAADAMDYATRPESAVPWGDVPQPNKSLMIATAAEVLAWLRARSRGKKP